MTGNHRDRARLITSEIVEIPAPIEQVWQVLTDFANYGLWNPLCSSISVEPYVGGAVEMIIHDPRTSEPLQIDYILRAMDHPGLLAWEKDFPEISLRARRDQMLQSAGPGRTLYYSTDLYDGPGADASFAEHAGWVRESLSDMGRALRTEVARRGDLHHGG